MIEYRKGNLLDVTEGIIVHGCNARGVMGSGVAKAIRDKYPACYTLYNDEYASRGLLLGDIIWWCYDNDHKIPVSKLLYIANGITQEFYGKDGKRHVNYVAVGSVFKEVFRQAYACNLDVHFPKIGAGLGGGDWNIIEQIINDADNYNRVNKICWEL